MRYEKLPIGFDQQIAILKQRGLLVANETEAIGSLKRISYFRLAEYWRPMEKDKTQHIFKSGSKFEDALSLYQFDKRLRMLLFSAIQDIEISLRTQMIHHFSLPLGAFWFSDISCSLDIQRFNDNVTHIRKELDRSHEEFIKEHFRKYTIPPFPPAWKTLEVLSFGTLSKLYSNVNNKDAKKQIAHEYGLPKYVFLESWMACVAVLRNCCAHHARVWNRHFALVPKIPNRNIGTWISDVPQIHKLYPVICCIAYLLNRIYPRNHFNDNVRHLLSEYAANVDVSAMGFPDNWKDEPLWV